jgi:hypothetical protein
MARPRKARRSSDLGRNGADDDRDTGDYIEEEDMFQIFPPQRFRKAEWTLSVLMSG